jgi:hypothetical protein
MLFSQNLLRILLMMSTEIHEDAVDEGYLDLLPKYDLSIDDLKKRCDRIVVSEVAKHLSQWKQAHAQLGFTQDEVIAIERDNAGDELLKRQAFLDKWMEKHGDTATYKKLVEALKFCQRRDLIEQLFKKMTLKDDGVDSDSSDMKEEDLRFLCGCGHCSLNSFISQGCRYPWENTQFPLLDVKKLPYRERLELFKRLENEAQNVAVKFGSVTRQAVQLLKNVDPNELAAFLLPQQMFIYMDTEERHKLQSSICDAPDAGKIIVLLCQSYISWFNHHLLAIILDEFKCCKDKYDDYVENHFKPFMQKSLFEIPSSMLHANSLVGSGQFILKVDVPTPKEHVKAKILSSLSYYVSSVFGLALDSFTFISYDKGCIRLTVSVPYLLLSEIFPLPQSVLDNLSKFTFENVRIKGVQFDQYQSIPLPNGKIAHFPDTIIAATNISVVMKMFGSILVELYRIMEESNENLEKVKKYFMELSFLKRSSLCKTESFPLKKIVNVQNSKSAIDLVVALIPFVSFFNYKLLAKGIRCNFSNSAAETKFKSYIEFIEKLRVDELPPLIQPIYIEHIYHADLLKVYFTPESFLNQSVDDISIVQDRLASFLGIESFSLLLKHINKTENSLEYLVPLEIDNIITDELVSTDLSEMMILKIIFKSTVHIVSCKKSCDKDSGISSDESSLYSGITTESETEQAPLKKKQQNRRNSNVRGHASLSHLAPPFIPQTIPTGVSPHQTFEMNLTNDFGISNESQSYLSFLQHETQLLAFTHQTSMARSHQLYNVSQPFMSPLSFNQVVPHDIYSSEKDQFSTSCLLPQNMSERQNFQSRVRNTVLDEEEFLFKEQLSPSNYRDMFYYLLCDEESEHIKLLSSKCDGLYRISFSHQFDHRNSATIEHDQFIAQILGMNDDQIQYAVQASEAVFLINKNKREELSKAAILPSNYYLETDTDGFQITLESIENLTKLLPPGETTIEVNIEFEVKHHYFDVLHKAVVIVPQSMIKKILPTRNDVMPLKQLDFKLSNKCSHKALNVNENEQFHALKVILQSSPKIPIIISGSFGTGKTRVLARAAFEIINIGLVHIHQHTRILICAHHPITIDCISKLLEQACYSTNGVNLVKITRNYRVISSNFIHSDLLQFKKDINNGKYAASPVTVIMTTYVTSLQIAQMQPFQFTHIFLDEAAQVREPEAIAALLLGNTSTKVVIAGDSNQVGPSVLVLGQYQHMKASLLERLTKLYDDIGACAYVIHLNVNYRCHPEIACLLSSTAYKYHIESYGSCSSPHPKFRDSPCYFFCSHIDNTNDPHSRPHMVEAAAVVQLLLEFSTNSSTTSKSDVCIMSSFRTQLNVIKRLLNKRKSEVSLLTTYSIQGNEFKYLILSTHEPLDSTGCSSNVTKTLTNPKIFNTVISRTKLLVIAVGNPFRLLAVERKLNHNCWKEFIKRCLLKNTVLYSENLEHNKEKLDKLLKVDTGLTASSITSCKTPIPEACTIPSSHTKCTSIKSKTKVESSYLPNKHRKDNSLIKSNHSSTASNSPLTTKSEPKQVSTTVTTLTRPTPMSITPILVSNKSVEKAIEQTPEKSSDLLQQETFQLCTLYKKPEFDSSYLFQPKSKTINKRQKKPKCDSKLQHSLSAPTEYQSSNTIKEENVLEKEIFPRPRSYANVVAEPIKSHTK